MRIYLLALSLISSAAFAQGTTCQNKLLGFNRYTGLHSLMKDEWTDNLSTLDPQTAVAAMDALVLGKLICRRGELTLSASPTCKQMISNDSFSTVCYAPTNLGHFVISRDIGKNLNFIFSKDKKPTP